VALILGDDEVRAGTVGVKPLRGEGEQVTLPEADGRLAGFLAELIQQAP
jgi:hypothetical protein